MKKSINILFADSKELKSKAFEIRQEVFVVEQEVSREDEFDEFESSSRHFVALQNGLPVGAARWRKTENGIKLERFAVKKTHRGMGVGSGLVRMVIADIQKQIVHKEYLYLHAQIEAIPLYEKFGFQKTGSQFEECNIKHFKMEKYI